MIRIKLWMIPLALFCLGTGGCAQDSIFYNISYETIPKAPTIPGSPTRFVKFKVEVDGKSEDRLFVASGGIFEYARNDSGGWSWKRIPGPDGFVRDITSVGKDLYALTESGSGLSVWKLPEGESSSWTLIPNDTRYLSIQSIFGAGDKLFAGVGRRATNDSTKQEFEYAILYEDNGKFGILMDDIDINGETRDITLLTGAGKIGDTYYFGTMGTGILSIDKSLDQSTVKQENPGLSYDGVIVGLIQVTETSSGTSLGDNGPVIIAASRDGHIFIRGGSSASFTSQKLGGRFTGALALVNATHLADGAGETAMLLMGIEIRGSAIYGYREIPFDITTASIVGDSYKTPGAYPPSTVTNQPKFNASLGKLLINAIAAFPEPVLDDDGNPLPPKQILFASTQRNGLYSYRNDEWNGEQ
jgi:hypothetical protein